MVINFIIQSLTTTVGSKVMLFFSTILRLGSIIETKNDDVTPINIV